jgi:Transposase IS66 family
VLAPSEGSPKFIPNRLRVFRIANTVRLGRGGRPRAVVAYGAVRKVRGTLEFIPIQSLVATGSDIPGNYAGPSRGPAPERRRPPPEAAAVFDAATALDTALDLVDPQPTLVALLVRHGLLARELLPQIEINSDDWEGILVSDGYGVYQHWVEARQTCLVHLIRTARGLAERPHPEMAACGAWALAELQRLCYMAKAPPTGGEWRAWYARVCKLIDQYHDRQDDAGRLVRRLLREMDSLWVFLAHHGVEPTNNRAERAIRFGVQWRKRSLGTASEKGNRWVERILSLKET